jgi:proteasome activator subunit 3 (PA28 gamma)
LQDSGFAVLENMTKFFISRAKLISKVRKLFLFFFRFLLTVGNEMQIEKFPTVEDYSHSVVELDEKEYITLRLCLLDLRNSYAILHDMITKNLEKIKAPRGTNHMASLF